MLDFCSRTKPGAPVFSPSEAQLDQLLEKVLGQGREKREVLYPQQDVTVGLDGLSWRMHMFYVCRTLWENYRLDGEGQR
jgi:hypothetical protein